MYFGGPVPIIFDLAPRERIYMTYWHYYTSIGSLRSPRLARVREIQGGGVRERREV
jgi:hypothetical protein